MHLTASTQETVRKAAPALALLASISVASPALGAPTKEECIEAHGKGQDLREEGHLTRARQAFLTCSQKTCPALVQSDCSRFSEELSALVPTVSFAARDARANDLPDTRVYVDDALVTSRLDAGESYDVDPGRHVVRFTHDGKDVIVKIVVNQGEKGRNVIGNFPDVQAPGPVVGPAHDAPPPPPAPKRPIFPLVVAGAGGALAVTGIVLVVVGLGKVPSNCSLSSHECAAPDGDKAFDDAHSGVTLANVGLVSGIAGLALTAGGLVWYFSQTPKPAAAAASFPIGPVRAELGVRGARLVF